MDRLVRYRKGLFFEILKGTVSGCMALIEEELL